MNKKRISIFWILAIVMSLCLLSVVLVQVLPFVFSGFLISSRLDSRNTGIGYPSELLDGNEDHLTDLVVVGLPLSPVWEYQSLGPIDRPPLYRAGHLILKGDKSFWSVNANSGGEECRYESAYRIYAPFSDNVVVLDKAIAFQTYPWPSALHAVDLKTCHDLWETQSAVRGLASDDGSRLFVISANNYQALDATSGQMIWTSDIHPIERGGSPIFYDPSARELYVWEDTRILVVLDSDTGKLRRKLSHTLDDGSPSIVNSGILYIERRRPGSLLAMDGQESKTLWTKTYSPPGTIFQPMAYENVLYTRTPQETLLAINRHTGDILWQYPAGPDSSASVKLLSNLVVLDDIVYGIFSDAKLHGFDATTGQEIGHIQFRYVSNVSLDRTVPGLASSGQMLYVSLGKMRLYAFKVIP